VASLPDLGANGWAAGTALGKGDSGVGGEDEDGDDDSIIALVEADFQDALLQSYETFAQTAR